MPKLMDKIIKGKDIKYFAFSYDDYQNFFSKKTEFRSIVQKGLKDVDPTIDFKFFKINI
jgi:hypothetical protein